MFYYNSICSLSISLHLFRSLYQILLCYLFCSCFYFFILLLFGKDLMTLPVLYSFLSLFSLSLYYLSVLFMLLFCFCFYYFAFSFLFTPLFYMLLLFLLLTYYWFFSFWPPVPLFFLFIFIYIFIYSFFHYYYYYYYYFLSSLFCLYSFTTSAHWLGALSLILYTVSAVSHSSTCSVVTAYEAFRVLFFPWIVLFQFPSM